MEGHRMKTRSMTRVIYAALCVLSACASSQGEAEAPQAAPAEGAAPTAEATPPAEAPAAAEAGKTVQVAFQSKSGSSLAGSGTLTETSTGVQVALALENVPPGEHGAHVHEKGDCSAPDASSAGGHFNPEAHPHSLPEATPRHLGDLGNVNIGADGKGTLDIVATGANLKEGDSSSFLGKAIIIHEKKDDGGQPVGNAGGRIGCAEIQ
jgi:superoxide dismutase, Cu-Zn family